MKFALVRLGLVAVLFGVTTTARAAAGGVSPAEMARLGRQAERVKIVRDDWGIAHVTGKTDADAVFGMIYAQCEDDFNRVETNYITALGRTAEVEGEAAIWRDLRQKLFIDPEELKVEFARSPEALKELMSAWADGINYFLAKNPNIKPKLITRFEPWMALSFTEGSIGGDIESINLARLREMYGSSTSATAVIDDVPDPLAEPKGSNGIAISPRIASGKKALLLINPHTSFFFRSELQMTSGEGLNAYGAVTWGQFFIYQGFNERVGWMHTTSSADAIDEYRETIIRRSGRLFYKHGTSEREVVARTINIPYKLTASTATRAFRVFSTHHGPIIRKNNDSEWIAVSLMNTPMKALMQSWGRTKARNLEQFKKVMELKANSSNNTLYADADGHIAYFHVNYVPRRDDRFNWRQPVDGADPATDHNGIHDFAELPHLIDPPSGWAYNTNNFPWSAAGTSSLKAADFPKYVDNGSENARGLHALRVLQGKKDWTPERLRAAAYDSYLPWFEKTIPVLIAAFDALSNTDPRRAALGEQIETLRKWNYRWGVDSVATSLAVFWGEQILGRVPATPGVMSQDNVAEKATPAQMLDVLQSASNRLTADFGKWQTPWGEVNRFQRLTADIIHPFDDAKPSIPVGFTSGNWGSLASFGARPGRGTKKWYGTSGNSFVAVVEFGNRVRAIAVTAGGESGDPASPHFNDQAARYAAGDLRSVYFYPDDLKGKVKRTYFPGL